jgi:DNA mismatch endonuclease (patch repair protein)
MDVFTKRKRSEIMSNIRSKNTTAEKVVFKALRKDGIYFQKHYKKAPGNPDIALPKKKIAIFIDGDFWHGYKYKVLKQRLPKKYWLKKIEDNIKRDKRNRAKLKREGWKVLRIWEHDIEKNPEKSLEKIVKFLKVKNFR